MTDKRGLTRRHALAGAAVLGAPLPLRYASAQSAPANLKVGLILPTSGALALIGQACRRGGDIANYVLAEAGIPVKLDIVNYDTETKADVARTQAEKAVDAGCHVLMGAFDSGQTVAIAQVCEQRGIPLVVNIAASPPLTESGYKFIVRNFPTAPMLLASAFDLQKQIFAASGVTPKTAVLLSINDTFGSAMLGGIKAMFPKAGMPYEIVDTITYDAAAKDLSVEVAKAKASKAEMLMPICRLNDAKLIVQEMVKQRWEPMTINPGTPGMYEQDFIKSMGKYSEYTLSIQPWLNPKSNMTKVLEKHHAAKFPGVQIDIDAGFTFEALLIAADAYKRAGSADPKALADALHATNITENATIGPGIKFDAKGQNVGIPSAAVQSRNRTPTVVLPATAATMTPVLPMPGWQGRG